MGELQVLANETALRIAAILTSQRQTIAVTESSTGGLISACLLAVPGASAFYQGGSVIYTRESRKTLLHIRREDVEGLQPLTEAMAMAFAKQAREQLNTTWGIAELGVAGPTGAPYGHPPGTSVIAIHGPQSASAVVDTQKQDREANMWAFTQAAMDLLAVTLAT